MTANEDRTGADRVCEVLQSAGIQTVIGLPGTQTLPIDRTIVTADEMRYVMARHETAIPHIAWGAFETSGNPVATLTVPGPGDTNVMHGLKNAREDCVPIIHLSADIDPADRGKGPIHEIEPETFDTVVKQNVTVESPSELVTKLSLAIQTALEPPYGPVRVGLPSSILESPCDSPSGDIRIDRSITPSKEAIDSASELLNSARRPVLFVGGGVRRSETGVRHVYELARRLNAPVVSTFKGKGVFPEDDPRFAGVAGGMLPPGASALLSAADVVLALGSDFDGVTTGGWTLPLGERLVTVTLDPKRLDEPYEADVGIVSDAGEAVSAIVDTLPARDRERSGWDGAALATAVWEEYDERLSADGLLEDTSPAKTPATLRALREALPQETVVATDVGGFRLWAFEAFETYAPEQYVTAGSWAGMGVGLPGAIGAKLAHPDVPVVALTGDGGLLMCLQELHTAVEEEIPVVVVVFNNADYGTISKSSKITTYAGDRTFAWNSPNFIAIARGMGCRATAVERPSEVGDAVCDALERDVPTLVEVTIDPDEPDSKDVTDYHTRLPDKLDAS